MFFYFLKVLMLKVILYIHQLNATYNYGDKIRRCLYLLSIFKCKMMKIIFFQSTFTGIGSSFLSVETKLKLFSFIQSLNIVCAIMNDGIGSGCYGNWRQLATNSYLHLQTISNDTCLFFLGFLKSHFLK